MTTPRAIAPVVAMALLFGAGIVAMGAIPLMPVTAAKAHATIELYGEHAKAGRTGSVTMRIPHGCNGSLATDGVAVKFGRQWKARPQQIDGWEASVSRHRNGRRVVTWSTTTSPLPPTQSMDFTMAVRFPAKPGLYSLPTLQTCGTVQSDWSQPDRGGADGDHPYPADYPVPKIWVK